MANTRWAPEIGWAITLPSPLTDSARFLRIHKRASKDAAVSMLKSHQLKRMPRHFTRAARSEYNHYPRKERYKQIKKVKFGSITDLVKTGKTKRQVLGGMHRIQIGGDAVSGLRARMFIAMPFPVGETTPNVNVTSQRMMEELERWTQRDIEEAAAEYQEFYTRALEAELEGSPRLRKLLGAAK